MNLLDALASSNGDSLRAVTAKVTAVSGRKVTLSVQGSTVAGIPLADSYGEAAVDDVALVLKVADAWVAVSRLSATGQRDGFRQVYGPATARSWTGLRFDSKQNSPSDGAYLIWDDDYYSDANLESGRLTLGVKNDSWTSAGDHLRLEGAGHMIFNLGPTDARLQGQIGTNIEPLTGSEQYVFRFADTTKVAINGSGNISMGTQLNFGNPCIRQEGEVQYVFLWDNIRWMQLYALGYTSQSSRRLKREIQDLPVGLSKVREFAPRRYKMDMSDDPERLRDGLIAEELFEVYPEAVSLDLETGEPQGIDYGALTPVLIRALQELADDHDAKAAQVADLETRLAAAEERAAARESRLAALEEAAAARDARLAALEAKANANSTAVVDLDQRKADRSELPTTPTP